MGGRGSKSGGGVSPATVLIRAAALASGGTAPIPNVPNVQNQAPSAQNTPVTPNGVTVLSQMTDDQLAQLMRTSKSVDMPNHLNDVDDKTQKFVYAAGINEKPTVLNDADFNKYLSDNKIPRSQILSRSVDGANYTVNGVTMRLSADQIAAMTKDSALTYVGGKRGGMLHGAGTYFDMNGGRSTGYGSGVTMIGVLSKNARVIDDNVLRRTASTFARSHPKFAREVGSVSNQTLSIYALAMGYNVIQFGSYHNIIDRSALVMRSSNL